MSAEPAKPAFNLSVSNVIYLAVVTIALFVLHLLRHGLSANEDAISSVFETSGTVFGLLLWPALLAWFFWRFSGRRKLVGSLIFNLVLTLAVVGTLGRTLKETPKENRDRAEIGQKIQQERTRLKQELANTKNPEDAARATEQYLDVMQSGIREMQARRSGTESEVYRIIGEFNDENTQIVDQWGASLEAVQSGTILDTSRLDNADEFRTQREAIALYVDASQAYRDKIDNAVPEMEKRLKSLGPNHPAVRGALNGLKRGHELSQPMIGFLDHHITFGNRLVGVLEFLEVRQDEWNLHDGEIEFDNDATLATYDTLMTSLDQDAATLNELGGAMAAQFGKGL